MKRELISKYTSISILILLSTLVMGQESKGERYSEEEIGLQDLYIAANQKKILLKYDDAIEIYKKILDRNEVNASVHHDLARIYHEQKNDEKAVASAKKAIRYDPSNEWYKLTLIQIYEETLQYHEASNLLAQIIVTVEHENLYDRWARNLEFGDKKLEAIKAYDLADQKFGWAEERSDSKVDLYLATGKEKEALNEIEKWSKRTPDNIDYQLKLARYYDFRGNRKKARKTYEKILILDPDHEEAILKTSENLRDNSTSELSSLIHDSRIGIDNKIMSLVPHLDGANTEILSLCESLTIQYPNDAKAFAIYGDALWLNNDATGAVNQYEQSLKINKSIYEVWDQLMLALSTEERYDHLDKISTEAMDYYPNQAGPYYYQALSLLARGKSEDALEINDEAMFISEGSKTYISERAIILKAQILDSQNNTGKAIAFIESIQKDKITASLMELLGDLYLKAEDKVSAEKAWQESLKLGGNKSRINQKIQSI